MYANLIFFSNERTDFRFCAVVKSYTLDIENAYVIILQTYISHYRPRKRELSTHMDERRLSIKHEVDQEYTQQGPFTKQQGRRQYMFTPSRSK